ncbi:MAG: hypothetical protein V4584_01130 [Verrucomicrobiota bacterium]
MKPKSRWIIFVLIAVVCGCFYFSGKRASRITAIRLGAKSAELAEQQFLKLPKDEVTRTFPNLEHGVSASGGVASGPDHYESIKVQDIYFWASVPVSDVGNLIDRLCMLPEIAEWKAAGPRVKLQGDCKFVLSFVGPGNQPNDRPMIRMLFHESDWPVVQMDHNQLGFWNLHWNDM